VRAFLTRLLAHPVDETSLRIIDLPAPILAAGMSIQTDMRRVYRDVPRLGKRYRDFKQSHEIPDRKDPWAFVAVSRGFKRDTGTFMYAIGDVVTSLTNLPAGLETIEIPAMAYAVLPVRPKNKFAWGFAIAGAKQYAYETWLPNSMYQPGRVIDDFELHDERSTRAKSPEIALYVCVVPRDTRHGEAG